MDEQVLAAMVKWPHVPAAFGWLYLTERGRYLLRRESIGNAGVEQFIARNYVLDEQGRAYFQNGPQRVYAQLAYCPWVLRFVYDDVSGGIPSGLITQTQHRLQDATVLNIDQNGKLSIQFELGLGLLDSLETQQLAHCISMQLDAWIDAPAGTQLTLSLRDVEFKLTLTRHSEQDLPRIFRFVRDPQAD